jgi:hypothetical protein
MFVLPIATRTRHAQFGGMGGDRMPNVVTSTEVRESVPRWLELPRQARVQTGDDLDMKPLHNAAVSLESLRIGILIGALRNDGTCATDVNARLQYVDANWKPMGPPIPNEARVSRVEPGGIFPYRFRLRNIGESDEPPAAYLVIVEQDGKPMANPYSWTRWVDPQSAVVERTPCPASDTTMEAVVTRRNASRSGYLLQGTVTVEEGGPVRADGLVITAILRDSDDNLLEVLVGTPTYRERDVPTGVLATGQQVGFRLRTDVPLGRSVAQIDLVAELLPDARVDQAPQPR